MPDVNSVLEAMIPVLPPLVVVVGVVAVLWGVHWFLIGRHANLGDERKFPRQIVMIGLALVGLVALILSLPIDESSRNRLLGLIGLLASGILAFSSTTVVSNLMAGILLRVTKPFGIGDFVRVGDYFGRVSERGLFDTEIQSETRELIAIPNSFLISNPVTAIRGSGAIVSATLSLGYDVHHSRVEGLLVTAAKESGLEEPFVQILEMGNFTITYRISGVLTEVKWLITARTNLTRSVLDVLHRDGVEIMSPDFRNLRMVPEDRKIVPVTVQEMSQEKQVVVEDIVFDKAEQAEQIDNERRELLGKIEEMERSLKETSGEEEEQIRKRIEEARKRLEVLEQNAGELGLEDHVHESAARRHADKPSD